MIIKLISDIHTEIIPNLKKSILDTVSKDEIKPDVLVIAGDLSNMNHITDSVNHLCDKYEDIVFVAGNHEYYGSFKNEVTEILSNLNQKHNNFHWLENSSFEKNGVRFLGTTLFFPKLTQKQKKQNTWYNPYYSRYEWDWSDFISIKGFESWVYEEHEKATQYLVNNIKSTDIVVTHYLPIKECISERWKDSDTNCFFHAKFDKFIKKGIVPNMWLFGHTHDKIDIPKSQFGCRFVCNPLGYISERQLSDYKNLYIEV